MKVNKAYKFIVGIAAIVSATSFTGCEKDDSSSNFGEPLIYMPQGLLNSDRSYIVPQGLDEATRNFKLDEQTGRVNVILGVSRTAKASAEAFSVTVKVNADTINELITKNVLQNTSLLPAELYTLPQTVSVADGQTTTSFYLSIDKSKLNAMFAGKKAALAVVLASPTRYKLNEDKNKTIIVIDVDALKLP